MSDEDVLHTETGVPHEEKIVPAVLSTAMLAAGYVVGWIHGAGQYQRSAVWFAAGIVVTALFALALVAIQRRHYREVTSLAE